LYKLEQTLSVDRCNMLRRFGKANGSAGDAVARFDRDEKPHSGAPLKKMSRLSAKRAILRTKGGGMGRRAAFLATVVLILSVGIATAQVATGTISGTVKDASGGVMPGVAVTIVDKGTGISRTVESDSDGHYRVPSLPVGEYDVTATMKGFDTEVRSGIVLTVGSEAIADLALKVGSVGQTVEVTGAAPIVESTTATIGSLVDETSIRALPLNGRSYDQLALIQPNVVTQDPGPITGTPFKSGSGKRFSVNGQRPTANLFLLDGTDVNDQANGTPGGAAGTNLGVDTIQEFKIYTSSFKAEYGHSDGSIVSAVTRSGTNDFHGTAFEYIRNSVLDAKNYFDTGSAPPFRRNQFGGVLGGPIKSEKAFFFLGYEGLRQGQETTLNATVPDLASRQGNLPTGPVAINPVVVPYLNLYPLPNGPDHGDGTASFLSTPEVVTNEDNVMARVDYQLNKNTGIFGRYEFDQDYQNAPGDIPLFGLYSNSRRQYATVQANSVLSVDLLNDFRFAYNRTFTNFDPLSFSGPLSWVPGQPLGGLSLGGLLSGSTRPIASLGGDPTGDGPSIFAFGIWQWADDLSYVKGKHSFKTGVDVERVQDNTPEGNQQYGGYTFNTFAQFLAGKPTSFGASFPLGSTQYWAIRQTLIGVYAQDDYDITPRLTLNLGLRWEATTNPASANGEGVFLPSPAATATVDANDFFVTAKKNFSPRIGLAWRPTDSGRTVVRAGAGIYYNQILPWLYPTQLKLPPFYTQVQIKNPAFPSVGDISTTGASAIKLKAMNPFEKTPTSYQYTTSIEHQLSTSSMLEVSYAGSRGLHIQQAAEADTAVPTFIDGSPFYAAGAPRVNPAWNGITYYQDIADSLYNSLTIKLQRQAANGLVGQVFYTLSKATDDATPVNTSDSSRIPAAIQDPYFPKRDWSLSEFDQRNRVGYNLSYPIPFRPSSGFLRAVAASWTVDSIGTFASGLPFTAQLSTSVSRDDAAALSERPNLNPGFSASPTSGVSAGCTGLAAGTPVGNAVHWYDPCAFSLPAAGTYGDVGRDSIIGPGIIEMDAAVEKVVLARENINMKFRFEMFNILNHANFGLPNAFPLLASGSASGTAGQITYTTTSSRQLQFALRLNF
jgi:outer membrane receptor protein involved in Fe transport